MKGTSMPALRSLASLALLALAFTAGAEDTAVSPDAAPAVAPDAVPDATPAVAPDGQPGRLHVVQKGDTLWEITDHYLGTPWVWPSLWKENELIRNPHLIHPGDLIWITDRGIRKVTPEEAQALLRQQQQAGAAGSSPAAAAPAEDVVGDDPFGALDGQGSDAEMSVMWPGVHRAGFVSADELAGAAAVLGSHDEDYWASQGRRTIVSLGEGQTHVGDPYTVFRVRRRVHHPVTGKVVGYFIEVLGKAEVTEVHPQSSYAKILTSYGEIQPGDRVISFEEPPTHFVAVPAEQRVEGVILAQQPYRQWSGDGDLVILDRGTQHGLKPGVELEVFREGKEVVDPLTTGRVLVPEDVVGRLLVLRASPENALALVREARTEMHAGDRVRSD
jgi:hypothetical protein